MRYALVGLVASIAGCQSAPVAPIPFDVPRHSFTVRIEVGSDKMKSADRRVKAESEMSADTCVIRLRKYPVCLLHELRHCIEGDWHPRNEQNTEDC